MMIDSLLALCITVQVLGMSDYREKKACDYMPQIIKSSKIHDIKPEIIVALIFVESSFNRKSVSRMNACGLTQVIPKYTGRITKAYSCSQLKNPKTSIKAGTKILRWWIDYHGGNVKRALCSYNAGFRCSSKRPSRGGMKYAKKVLEKSRLLEAKKNQLISN